MEACCGAAVPVWARCAEIDRTIPPTNNWWSASEDAAGRITSGHGFQKGDPAGSGPGEGWSALVLTGREYDTGWIRGEIFVKWHQPKTTAGLFFLKSVLTWKSQTARTVLSLCLSATSHSVFLTSPLTLSFR